MKRINDRLFLEMIDSGKQQQECAAHFGVSGAAVCKRLQRLRPGPRPAILDKLTEKEVRFAVAVAGGSTLTEAALQSFECGSRDSAKTIGHRLGKDAEIQLAIRELMEQRGLGRTYRVDKLLSHVQHPDANVSLRALDMSFKLADDFPAQRRVNVDISFNADPVTLADYLVHGEAFLNEGEER